MSRLEPRSCVVIGEGSSGGATGIGVGDHTACRTQPTYLFHPRVAQISFGRAVNLRPKRPRHGCYVIDTEELGIVDTTIQEPWAVHTVTSKRWRVASETISGELDRLCATDMDSLVESRYQHYMYTWHDRVWRCSGTDCASTHCKQPVESLLAFQVVPNSYSLLHALVELSRVKPASIVRYTSIMDFMTTPITGPRIAQQWLLISALNFMSGCIGRRGSIP